MIAQFKNQWLPRWKANSSPAEKAAPTPLHASEDSIAQIAASLYRTERKGEMLNENNFEES